MTWIKPFEFNMDYSVAINQAKPDHPLAALAQKIAIYTIIPFALIVFCEAVVKNFIFYNLANVLILGLNKIHEIFFLQRPSSNARPRN